MPRKRKTPADFTPFQNIEEPYVGQTSTCFSGPIDDHSPISNAGEEDEDDEPDFYNVCPCSKCATKNKPIVRFMTTMGIHIQKHTITPTYEVRVIQGFLPHYIIVHSIVV
jgi:hypothetical protein